VQDGRVAAPVKPDGTEEIIRKSWVENGVAHVPLTGSATVKIIENSKKFDDVKAGDWYENAVNFVSSHELFAGMDAGFEPKTQMTRAMLITVLARLNGM
jgi:hypothetical protein